VTASVAIVILNWRGWRDTIECLRSLQGLLHESFAVVVVDNDSQDESVENISAWIQNESNFAWRGILSEHDALAHNGGKFLHRDAVLIRSPENGGFAFGNNQGIRFALGHSASAVWLLNNDTVVHPDSLRELENKLNSDQSIGMVGSVLCFYDAPNIVQAIGGVDYKFWKVLGKQIGEGFDVSDVAIQAYEDHSPTYIAGASMLIPKAYMDEVGLMEESNFLYFEEIDWIMRAGKRWRTAIAINSRVYHKEGGSIGTASRDVRSTLSQYYLIRGLVRFYLKYKPLFIPLVFARLLKDFISLVRHGHYQHAVLTLKATWAALMREQGKRIGI
jgi:GT2 family glycosyltransferase